MKDTVELGAQGSAELVVTSYDTAIALRSGDVPVLGTPRLIALLEEATCEALRGVLSSHRTSVGIAVDVSHRRASPVGARVVAHASVVSIDDGRVVFDVHADHETPTGELVEGIARGRITRAIVDRDSFGS